MLKFAADLIARGYPGPWVRKALSRSQYTMRPSYLTGNKKPNKKFVERNLKMVRLYMKHGPTFDWIRRDADRIKKYTLHDRILMAETVGVNMTKLLWKAT